jgi:predicted phage tail protein
MMTIILRGKLGERFAHPQTGNKWRLNVRSPAEGFHAIDTLMGGFFNYIMELESEMQGYHIQVGEKDIGAEMLAFGFGEETVTVTPLLQGADTKGVLQIVALIAAGLVIAGYSSWTGIGAVIGLDVVGLGLAVALGGVARLLANAPPSVLGTQDKTRSSYIFQGVINTIQQGECIPLGYGEAIIGSAVVAASIESIDVSV